MAVHGLGGYLRLVVVTFLTLVVVPTLYYLLERGKGNLVKGKEWFDGMQWRLFFQIAGEKGDIVGRDIQ